MALDPSVITPPAPQQINPLQLFSQVQGVRNAQAQNLILQTEGQRAQQQLGSDQAVGSAVQQATDPASGNIDWGQVNKLVAGNPAAALGAQASADNSTGQQRQQTALSLEKLQNFQQHLQAVHDAAASVLADPTATKNDVIKSVTNLTSNPDLDPDTKSNLIKNAVSMVGSIPDGASTAQVHQVVQGAIMQTAGAQAQIATLIGQNTATNVGGRVVMGRQAPLTGYQQQNSDGSFTPTPALQNTLSPSEAAGLKLQAAQPVAGPVNADGSPTSTPLGARAGMGTITTGLGPGAQSAAGAAGTGAGNMLAADQNQAKGARERIYQLNQALTGLQNSKTGPGSDSLNQLKSYLVEAGVDKGLVGQVKSYDEANKYLTQYAMSQAGSLGPGTDQKLAAAFTGNASTHISNLAAQDVVKSTIAVERARQSMVSAWQQAQAQSGGVLTPADYPDWANRVGQKLDTRAFAVDMMNPAQRKSMLDKMTPAERSNFFASYHLAKSEGLLTGMGGQ